MKKTCLMVLAGAPPSEDLLMWRIEDSDYRIAVDGGFLSFTHADKIPDLLIGDLDSIPDSDELENKYPQLKIVRLREQDTTDFEKALNWVVDNLEVSNLIFLGALGKRTDHLITNLLVASNIDESLNITLDHDDEWICRVTPSSPLTLHGRKGATLSILPIQMVSGVITKGLKWELDGEKIGGTRIIGQSNLCESDLVEISCQSGSLFVFLQKGKIA